MLRGDFWRYQVELPPHGDSPPMIDLLNRPMGPDGGAATSRTMCEGSRTMPPPGPDAAGRTHESRPLRSPFDGSPARSRAR